MSVCSEVDVSCVAVIVFIGVIVLFSWGFFCPSFWSDPDVFLSIVLYLIFRELSTGSVAEEFAASMQQDLVEAWCMHSANSAKFVQSIRDIRQP